MTNKKQKSSKIDQLSDHFQSLFIYFFSFPDPKSDFFPCKLTHKKSGLIKRLYKFNKMLLISFFSD